MFNNLEVFLSILVIIIQPSNNVLLSFHRKVIFNLLFDEEFRFLFNLKVFFLRKSACKKKKILNAQYLL